MDAVDPGGRLKEVRTRLGITTREVALFSKAIADSEGNKEFLVSSPWLTQIENEKKTIPSIYKLFTLASIYGLSYTHLLALYGVDVTKATNYHALMPIAKTHLAEHDHSQPASYELPFRFDPSLNLSRTNLLSTMIETWGRVPLDFLQHLDVRHRSYGFVGLNDYTLYPLLRPGSFVEIDPEVKKIQTRAVRSEFDRPIYFVDLRNEYACSWCEIFGDKLLLVTHPLSPVKTRMYAFPKDAEIVGQVIGVAMRIAVALDESRNEANREVSLP
jgi:transcriptional regulator with XRE-family HTH domain